MEQTEINSLSNTVSASILTRLFAYLVDSCVLGIGTVILIIIYIFINNQPLQETLNMFVSVDSDEFYVLTSIVLPVIGLLYYTLLESSKHQATVGKSLLGIKVVNEIGERPSLGNCFIRNVVKELSKKLFFIGHCFAFFNPKKQTAYDMLAKTYVIKNKQK